jgi:hypothetical protein
MPPLNNIPHHGPPLPIDLTPGEGWDKGWTEADHEALARLLAVESLRTRNRQEASRHMVRDLVALGLVLLGLLAFYEMACATRSERVDTVRRLTLHDRRAL